MFVPFGCWIVGATAIAFSEGWGRGKNNGDPAV